MKSCLSFLLSGLLLAAQLSAQNNTLRGRVLYQSSGNKPAPGVHIKEQDSNGDYSKDNGDYRLTFQTKRNGASLALELGPDAREGKKIELVNEKEIKAAKLPDSAEELLDIIVCPAGQRDIAAQRYYRILRTTADRELERKKKEVEELLEQKEKDYQKISDLFALIDKMQAALDSAKIREQAFNIASINLDRASQMMKDAVKKIEEENDVEGALKILNAEALDSAYEHASALKKQVDAVIKQVIEGYEFKISLLEPQFKYGEVAECYEKIAGIYEKEGYDKERWAFYFNKAAFYLNENGEYQKALKLSLKAIATREKVLPANHPLLATSYDNLAWIYDNLGNYQKALKFNLKALFIQEKILPTDHPDLAISYESVAWTYRNLGNNQKALEFNQKAFAIREKIVSVNHPALAMSYNNLAWSYGNLGEYQKQLEFNLKALSIQEKILPTDRPDLATSYNNLAKAYGAIGDYQKQLEFNLKALIIFEKVLPANHPKLATSYNNLAATYGNLGEYQKALEFILRAMTLREKVLPADHRDLVNSYFNVGLAYRDVGEYEKGIEYGQKAIQVGETANPKPSYLNHFYANLGITYVKARKYPEAKTALEKSQSLKEEERVYRGWAIYYASQKQKKEAIESLQKAVSLGLKDLKWLETEPDLKNIRKEEGYKELVERLKKG